MATPEEQPLPRVPLSPRKRRCVGESENVQHTPHVLRPATPVEEEKAPGSPSEKENDVQRRPLEETPGLLPAATEDGRCDPLHEEASEVSENSASDSDSDSDDMPYPTATMKRGRRSPAPAAAPASTADDDTLASDDESETSSSSSASSSPIMVAHAPATVVPHFNLAHEELYHSSLDPLDPQTLLFEAMEE